MGIVLISHDFFLNADCEFNVRRNTSHIQPLVGHLKVFLSHDKTLVHLQGQVRPPRC
jgi:hypothetical protein